MKKTQLRIAVFFSLMFLSAIFLQPSFIYAAQKISVGVYDFKPLVFIENGGAEGFFIDFLNYVAEKEHWEITYITGSWNDCLTRIETGKTDLQVAIAYSDERAKKLDFTDDYLISDWASVFKQKGSPIQTIFDLKDKTVSVVKGGITTDNFKKMLEQFGITCRLLEKEGNEDNFKAVHQREADAGISPNIYGTLLEHKYHVERTAIVFSPIKLKFAVKKDRNCELLAILDKYISALKADKSSVYYQSLNKWVTVYKEKEPLPRWALWILPVLIFSSLILFFFNLMLKKMVRTKTEELISSEERFRVLFEQAAVGVAQIDTETGQFIRINQKYCDIVGYTPDEMTKTTFQNITHPEDLQADLQNMQMLTDGKIREFSMEKRYYHKNGSAVWVNLTVSPMWKIGQEPDYHIAVVRDIISRKHAEANLRKSEQKYRRIVDTANEGVWMVDENEMTTFVNQRMAEMLLYCPEEMMGQSFVVFVFEEDLRDHEKQMESRKQGNSGYYERRFRRKDNTAIWTIVSATPVLNDEQQFRGSFAMVTDITERRRAEEAIRETESRFRSIIENTDAGYFFIDKDGYIRNVNSAWLRLYRYDSADEVLGQHFTVIQNVDDVEKAEEFVDEIMNGNNRYLAGEFSRKCKDGTIGYHSFSARPVFCFGTVAGIEGFIIDITKRIQTEEALVGSEKQFRTLFESMIEGVAIHQILYDDAGIPADYVILDVNPAYQTHTGILAKEAVGKNASELYGTSNPPYFDIYRKVITTGIPERFDVYFEPMQKHFSISVFSPAKDQFATIFEDITDRKHTEEELRRAHREWENIFQAIGHAAVILDPEYNIIAANRAITLAAGISEQDMIGKKCYQVFHGRNSVAPADGCPMKKMLLSKHIEAVDMEMEVFDGIFLVSCTPVFDEQGNLEKVIHIATDITERRRAEEELRRRKEELNTVLDALPVMVWIGLDPECRVITGNRAVNELLGVQVGSNVSQTAAEAGQAVYIRHLKPDGTECRADELPMQRAIATGKGIFNEELEYSLSDGRHLFTIGNAVPLFDEKNRVRGVVAAFLDITERKQMEKEHRKLESHLRQAQKMEAVGQLAGGVAHDFNNLLQVIIGYGDMILDQLPPGELLHKNLNEMMKSANRAAALVRQLLLFSRHDTMRTKSIDLTDLISNLMNMIRRVIGEHISLEIRPGFAVRPVSADPGQIEQVLMNLCVNARDAMPDGGRIMIGAENVLVDDDYYRQHQWAKKGQYVVITVSDTGVGIPHEIQERIFEPFFTTKEIGKGTGLGLATVYGIVRSHQGMIHLYSEPGHGAAFKIYLPAIAENPSDEVFQKENKSLSSGHETIMIAEDEDVVRNMMIHVLENSGYRVLSACNGEEAISLFEKHFSETDLVISDVIMPKMSGQKVYEHIRAVRPDIPVIFMSGYTRELLNPEVFENNSCEMIQKPCTPSVLLQKIRAVLDADYVQRRNT